LPVALAFGFFAYLPKSSRVITDQNGQVTSRYQPSLTLPPTINVKIQEKQTIAVDIFVNKCYRYPKLLCKRYAFVCRAIFNFHQNARQTFQILHFSSSS
jgi:hypothetical protein